MVRWILLYLVLLAASHGWTLLSDPDDGARRPDTRRGQTLVPALGDDGPAGEGTAREVELSWLRWTPASDAPVGRLPVLLLHGSPGSARNFEDLGPALAAAGREARAVDLPGFGRSARDVPSYSILAHARSVRALLEAEGIERVHVVAWSMGGGVALHLAQLDPERVASLTLLASIGVQEAEGSGSYAFEHFKYALTWLGLVLAPELVPHFGLWPGGSRSFVRNFWDTDQRPLRGLLERTRQPTLILHGREDFLVPAWAAEVSHELCPGARLVMLDAGHFLPLGPPLGQLPQTLEHLLPFLERHDLPGLPPQRGLLDLAPRSDDAFDEPAPFSVQRHVPWWLQLVLLAGLAWWFPRSAAVLAGVGIAGLQVDPGVVLIGCALGALGGALVRRSPGPASGAPGPGRLALRGLRALAGVLAWAVVGALLLSLAGSLSGLGTRRLLLAAAVLAGLELGLRVWRVAWHALRPAAPRPGPP